jgi:hypothetical protein
VTSNIERFDQLAGLVFAKLYEHFPIPVSLDIMEFHDVLRSTGDEGEVEPVFFSASVRWLVESGYISNRAEWAAPNHFKHCTLTAKALEVLKGTPSILTGESIGDELQSAVRSGAFETIKVLTNEALSRGWSMAVQAAANIPI